MTWRRGVPAGTSAHGADPADRGAPGGRGAASGAGAPAQGTAPAKGGGAVSARGAVQGGDGARVERAGRVGGSAPLGAGRLRIAIPARAGLGATAVSIALTVTVAVLGPSVMEPVLPGRAGQPPWAFAAHPSAYLAVALTFAAIAAGSFGLAVTMRAARLGWSVSPRVLLTMGLIAAAVLVLLPPFGSSDHLSYAAYGRMLATGHNPYLTTPSALARLGDPIARAVEDWRTSPSVYGVLATGGQALASLIGGTSVRLTVFVLSLLNLAGFAGTGLLLHRLADGDRSRQLRAALLWTCNPLLLLVLVAGAHVDSQAIVFGVVAVAAFALARRQVAAGATWRCLPWAFAAGLLAGLGFAVKLSMLLVAVGLAAACLLVWPAPARRARDGSARAEAPGGAQVEAPGGAPAEAPGGAQAEAPGRAQAKAPGGAQAEAPGGAPAEAPGGAQAGAGGRARTWAPAASALAGLAAGFAAVVAAALAIGGLTSLRPALRAGSYVAIATPWRWVRAAIGLATSEGVADDIVKVAAAVTVLVLAWLLLRGLPGPDGTPCLEGSRWLTAPAGTASPQDAAGLAGLASLAFVLAWLTAGPYVLPWYDGLAWALLPLLPWSAIDWLVLARTTALAIGYLPARGIVMPAGLGWLVTVVRRGVTPALLLLVAVLLVVTVRSRKPARR
jgi:hypothetical protein